MTMVVAGQRTRVVGPTVNSMAEAEAGLLQARAARDRQHLAAPDRITLGAWLDHWRETHSVTVSTSTAAQIRVYLSAYVQDDLRRVRLQGLTTARLRQMDAGMIARGLAASTRQKTFGLLRQALNQAVEDGLLLRSPAANLRIRATAADQQRQDKKRALPPKQTDALLTAADGHWLEIMVYLLFCLGVRRGEALGLRWSDVDFRDGTVRIHQQIRLAGNVVEIAPLKTKSSRRTLHMDDTLRDALLRQQQRQAGWRTGCAELWTDCGLVITDEIGRLVSPRVPNRVLGVLAREAGIPRLSSHSGRHTAITGQLRAGVPIDVVAARAGHRDGTVTAQAYRTVLQDELRSGGFDVAAYRRSGLKPDAEN